VNMISGFSVLLNVMSGLQSDSFVECNKWISSVNVRSD